MLNRDLSEAIKNKSFQTQDYIRFISTFRLFQADLALIQQQLVSGTCKEGITIDFSGHEFTANDIVIIFAALGTGLCPKYLKLKLSFCKLSDEAINIISTTLQSGLCPEGLSLDLSHNKFTDLGVKFIANALISGFCPNGIELNLSNNEIDTQGYNALFAVLKSESCPQRLNLHLMETAGLSELGLPQLKEALMSNTSSRQISLSLAYKNLSAAGAEILGQALSQTQHTLQINLNLECKSQNSAQIFFDTFKTGKFPHKFSLAINTDVASVLGNALKTNSFPESFHLRFFGESLKLNSAFEYISQALISGNCPNKFSLDASRSGVSFKSVFAALQTGKCPKDFYLNLQHNHYYWFKKDFIQALMSGKCPEGLTVNLHDCEIWGDDFREILKALTSGMCPSDLRLILTENKFTDVNNIIDVLKTNKFPPGLQLQLNPYFTKTIQPYIAQNNINYAALGNITLEQGLRTSPMLRQLPKEVAKLIYSYNTGMQKSATKTGFFIKKIIDRSLQAEFNKYVSTADRSIKDFNIQYTFAKQAHAESFLKWLDTQKHRLGFAEINLDFVESKENESVKFQVSLSGAQYEIIQGAYAFENLLSQLEPQQEEKKDAKTELLDLKADFVNKAFWQKNSFFFGGYEESKQPTTVAKKIISLITDLEKRNAPLEEWDKAKINIEKILSEGIAKRSSGRAPDTQIFYEQEYQKYFKK